MCPRVASLYPSDRKYQKIDFQCVACRAAGRPALETRNTIQHIISKCPFYVKYKQGVSLDTDIGLVTFVKRVIDDRAENDDIFTKI